MKGDEYIAHPTLTPDQQVRLLQLTKSGGYQLLLDIMEKICQIAETEHFQLKPVEHDAERIARSHAEARGQRLHMERTIAKLTVEVTALLQQQIKQEAEGQEQPDPTDEELESPYTN